MPERFIGYTDQPPIDTEAPRPALGGLMDKAKQVAQWAAPVMGDALRQEAGLDVYNFMGAEQPVLTEDQRFGSGVAQFALRRVADRLVAATQ